MSNKPDNHHDRIGFDPRLSLGLPCLIKHQIYVFLILDLLECGFTPEQLIKEYPFLEDADIVACIAYNHATKSIYLKQQRA